MKPKILKTEKEYKAALKLVDGLMDAAPGTPGEEDLELWSLLVEEYESRHFPMDAPDPIEAIKFRMDQMGLRQRDLTRYIPAKSKVSEVLNRKRPLSLAMIRALHTQLGIPVEVLVEEPKGEYALKPRAGAKPGKTAQKRS
ncbi:MAG: helix-turn-helix domain-containing protein [Oceanipulchritudo sp.]